MSRQRPIPTTVGPREQPSAGPSETLLLWRPARCERGGHFLEIPGGPCPTCGPEGCDVVVQNLHRYAWSESNVCYQLLGPERGRRVAP